MHHTISKSLGKKAKLSKNDNENFNNKKKFWRMSWIYESEFEDLADTGDFIICSNITKDGDIVNYENVYLIFKMEDKFD